VLTLAASKVGALCLTAQFLFRYQSNFHSFLVNMSRWMPCWYSGSRPFYKSVMWPQQGYSAIQYRMVGSSRFTNPR